MRTKAFGLFALKPVKRLEGVNTMNNQERHVALDLIANAQEDCSSVTVQIGGTKDNGIVEHDTLYIDECPASVVNKLGDNGFSLSMTEEGLKVDKY